MMVKIEFETANAAFGESEADRRTEIARILRALAQVIEVGISTHGAVFDLNGNRVGTFDLNAKGVHRG